MTMKTGAFGLLAALIVAACSSGPSAGELVVNLASPNADTRAVQFSITAAESKMVEGVTPACAACQVFSTSVTDGDLRGVVVGTIVDGPLLRITVSDVEQSSAYTARVVEAANESFLLLGAGNYTLTVARP